MAVERVEGFSYARRGYEPAEVDDYIERTRAVLLQLDERALAAESALEASRAELASPGGAGFSKRLDAILELAKEEAAEIRAEAKVQAEETVARADDESRRILEDIGEQRDAIRHEIEDLTEVRERLLSRLSDLHDSIGETRERFEQHEPGQVPPTSPYDAETRPLSELDPDTEILTAPEASATIPADDQAEDPAETAASQAQ